MPETFWPSESNSPRVEELAKSYAELEPTRLQRAKIADAIVSGEAKPSLGIQMANDAAAARKRIEAGEIEAERFLAMLNADLKERGPKASEIATVLSALLKSFAKSDI